MKNESRIVKIKENERENGATIYFKTVYETAAKETPVGILVPLGLGDIDATFIRTQCLILVNINTDKFES